MNRNDELKELTRRVSSLRAAIARTRDELASATAAEQAVVDQMRALGVTDDFDVGGEEESKTTIDRIEAGLPGQRRSSSSRKVSATSGDASMLKAGVVGAGLMLGVTGIVLLAMNLARPSSSSSSSSTTSSAALVASASPPPVATAREIPPPEPPEPVATVTAIPAVVSAAAPSPPTPAAPAPVAIAAAAPPSGNGALTVICTPKCDAISDNNIPLSPNNVVNVPVPAGQHRLALSAPNGVKKTMVVAVTPGQTKEVRVAMDTSSARIDYGF